LVLNNFGGFQVFPDGIYPAGGKSDIEGIFPPPYFEWFQFNKVNCSDGTPVGFSASQILRSSFSLATILNVHPMQEFTEYTNLDECISYLCDYMVKNGPFDGLLGFSQVISPKRIAFNCSSAYDINFCVET
jgi:calmodulin